MCVATVCMMKTSWDMKKIAEDQTNASVKMQSLDAFLQFRNRFNKIRDDIPVGENRKKFVLDFLVKNTPNVNNGTEKILNEFSKDDERYDSAFRAYWNHVYDEWYFFKRNESKDHDATAKAMAKHWDDYLGPATAASLDLSDDRRALAYHLVFLKLVEQKYWPFGSGGQDGNNDNKIAFLSEIQRQFIIRCGKKDSPKMSPENSGNLVYDLLGLIDDNSPEDKIKSFFVNELREIREKSKGDETPATVVSTQDTQSTPTEPSSTRSNFSFQLSISYGNGGN